MIHRLLGRFPTVMHAAVVGFCIPAVAIDLVTLVLRSPWTLPLGSLLGTAFIAGVILWQWREGPFSDSLSAAIVQVPLGQALIALASGAGALVFVVYTFAIAGNQDICARQVQCSLWNWLSLTAAGIFLSFLAMIWLLALFVVWNRVHYRDVMSNSEAE